MGIGGIILRTKLCVDGSESFGQFDGLNTFYYQWGIQIFQENLLTHGQICEIQDGR